jgi:NDP-sugar pyrophosphorylase family protein
VGSDFSNVTAAVLAGGLGTRLRSVIADRPKVLAPVAGRPFLAHLLERLERAGVRQSVLLVGFKAEMVRDAFGERFGAMTVEYSIETEPLGTAGALRLALPGLVNPTVLLMNGDSFCDVDLRAFLHCHRSHAGGATITLTHVDNAARFGRVHVDETERVLRFDEKDPKPAPGWINAGIYLFERELVETIATGKALSLERDVLPKWVASGRVRAFRGGGRFIDIGVPESYCAAEAFFATGQATTG